MTGADDSSRCPKKNIFFVCLRLCSKNFVACSVDQQQLVRLVRQPQQQRLICVPVGSSRFVLLVRRPCHLAPEDLSTPHGRPGGYGLFIVPIQSNNNNNRLVYCSTIVAVQHPRPTKPQPMLVDRCRSSVARANNNNNGTQHEDYDDDDNGATTTTTHAHAPKNPRHTRYHGKQQHCRGGWLRVERSLQSVARPSLVWSHRTPRTHCRIRVAAAAVLRPGCCAPRVSQSSGTTVAHIGSIVAFDVRRALRRLRTVQIVAWVCKTKVTVCCFWSVFTCI